MGGIVAGVGAFLHWASGDASTFDLPMKFLYDYKDVAKSSLSVGLVVLILAGVVIAAATIPQPLLNRLARPAGMALVVIAVAFLVQVARLSGEFDSSFTDLIGPGAFVTLVGGIAVVANRPK